MDQDFNEGRRTLLWWMLSLPLFSLFNNLGSVLPPKVEAAGKRYFLDEFHIAGFQFYDGIDLIDSIGVREHFNLKIEPTNQYDSFAVEVLRGDIKIGYIPRRYNRHIFRLLEQGATVLAEATEVDPLEDPWRMLKLRIWLIGL